MRRRWSNYELKKADTDCSGILSRFFFSGGVRAGLYANTLSKCWWVGKATYDETNDDHFERLDIIGAADFSTKVRDIFYSNNFSANPTILNGIINSLKYFNDIPFKLITKNHIRPALQYLNAVGGNVLLDALSTEEIEALFKNKIIELINGKDKDIDYDSEDDVSDSDDESTDSSSNQPVTDDDTLKKINQGYSADKEEARYVKYEVFEFSMMSIFYSYEAIVNRLITKEQHLFEDTPVSKAAYNEEDLQAIMVKIAFLQEECK